jgi:hypothetical protein
MNWHESFVSELTRFENSFASIDQFWILEKSPASTTVTFSELLTAREDPTRDELVRGTGGTENNQEHTQGASQRETCWTTSHDDNVSILESMAGRKSA